MAEVVFLYCSFLSLLKIGNTFVSLAFQDLRGLSQMFVDNMDNFVQRCGKKYIKTAAILPILLTIYTQNLNEMSLSLMTLC